MNDQFRQLVIEKLQSGEDLPAGWARALFPPEKREYELVYHGKEREEDILAETMAVPLQPVRTFGKNGDDWQNMLIFGDNLQAMKTLLEMKREGRLCNADGSQGIRLVYIDPPFASRKEYSGVQEEKAYQDKIIGAQFIEFLRKRLIFIRELLAPRWSVYIHLDEKKSHYIKAICDEVFGERRFQREIVWRIGWLSGYKTKAKNWIRNHDVILFYSDKNCIFNKKYISYSKGYTRRDGSPPTGEGYPIEDTWNCNEIDRLDSIQIMSFSGEKTGFPTQKNENLSGRIINASSVQGDIVLDAFVGSGTTCAVAEKLGRRWIGIDCGKLAIYTIQKRMLNLKKEIGNKGTALKLKPFTLYNAGLYDFSSLRNLPWKDWRFFALQLFGCTDEPHEIGGLALDGKLKGASVLVFNHHQDKEKTIDEGTIESIHSAVGRSAGSRFFIIAPRAVFDFQQDYIDHDGVRYYALRIPYSIIHELHRRDFTALKQPNDEMAVNDTVDAVGFDFIQPPVVQWMAGRRKSKKREDAEAHLTLKKFESRAKIKGKERKGGLETFSMLMLDFDYGGDVFDLDQVFYAQELEHNKWKATFPAKNLGKNIMAVFIDIYGNEARELIPVSAFTSSQQ